MDHDIRDVADKHVVKELGSGTLVIRTVGDYCDHMVRCYRTKPKDVIYILFKKIEQSNRSNSTKQQGQVEPPPF